MPKINTVTVNNTVKAWDLFYTKLSIPENLRLIGWKVTDKVDVITSFKTLEQLKEHYTELGYTYADVTKKDEEGYAIDIHYCEEYNGDCLAKINELREENQLLQDQVGRVLEMNERLLEQMEKSQIYLNGRPLHPLVQSSQRGSLSSGSIASVSSMRSLQSEQNSSNTKS